MRYFWNIWAAMTLERGLTTLPSVWFVTSSASSPLWRRYVTELAAGLAALGAAVAVHEATADVDEAFVARVENSGAIVIATDRGTTKTAWLATQAGGIPVYLLPGIDADRDDLSANDRLSASAGYRPEFDYLAPNRWAVDHLAAHSAWESRAVVPPVLRPPPLTAPGDAFVVIGATAQESAAIDAIAERWHATATHFAESPLSPEEIAQLAGLTPRVIVSFGDYEHSLEPLALMSLGAAFLGLTNEKTKYEILDGYNALLFDRSDLRRLAQFIDDVLSDDAVYQELRSNGHRSASVAHESNARQVHRALLDIAGRAY
jgi:hypothetical protein